MPERHPNPLRRLAQAVKWSKMGCYSTDKVVDPQLLFPDESPDSTPQDSPNRAPDQAAHRTGSHADDGGVLSAIDYRLSRLEMAFNLDISQDFPTSQLPRATDVISQRLLRLEKAAVGLFQEQFEERWHEQREATSATSAPSAHVAADAKQTLEAQAKQQVRQRLRYQPPLLSTPKVINDAREQGDVSAASADAARCIGALHPGPSELPSRSNWRQVKRRLGSLRRLPAMTSDSLRRLPAMTSDAATAAAEILGAGQGLCIRPAAEEPRRQDGAACEVWDDMRSEQDEPECLSAQDASMRHGARQDEPPKPLVLPCIHTREEEVQAHIALHTDAPHAVADVFYSNRDTVRASESAAGTFTASIDAQGNFRAWHPLLLRQQIVDADPRSEHSDFAPFIDVMGNFARKPPVSDDTVTDTTPDTHVQEVQAHVVLQDVLHDAPRAVADAFYSDHGSIPVSEAVAGTCTAAIDAQGNFPAVRSLELAHGEQHVPSFSNSFRPSPTASASRQGRTAALGPEERPWFSCVVASM